MPCKGVPYVPLDSAAAGLSRCRLCHTGADCNSSSDMDASTNLDAPADTHTNAYANCHTDYDAYTDADAYFGMCGVRDIARCVRCRA